MTTIEWVKGPDGGQGITVNSKTGCLNHTPEGLCLGGLFPCFAYKLANERLKGKYLANSNLPCHNEPDHDKHHQDPFYPRWWPERLAEISKIKKPTGIFLDDMSDWMGDYWPEEWTKMELQVMRDCPQHRFYTLTKQPQNLPAWSPFPENCWVGVTVTTMPMMLHAEKFLGDIKAKVKYISCEPLLFNVMDSPKFLLNQFDHWINWLIIGACTGTLEDIKKVLYARKDTDGLKPMPWGNRWTLQPPIEALREIVEAADKAGIPVFLKDNLKPLLSGHPDFWEEIPQGDHPNYESISVLRQEMPECKH